MNFRDLEIEISYKSLGDEKFSDAINPLLKCAKTYKRSVGFFSSSALSFIGEGLIAMARNGGHFYLATSPRLSEEDILVIQQGYEARELLKNRFLKEVEEALGEIDDANAELLYLLVKENIVDVKIVTTKTGMYHDKLAVLEDFDGNVVVCVGSPNESGAGYNSNYEKTRLFKSWEDSAQRIKDESDEFESIWSNENGELVVYDFQEAFQEKLLERVEKIGVFSSGKRGFEPRPYQDEAKNNWINNNHKGFFVMATGTGKTLTSLYSIKELIEDEKVFTVIAVPYKHLVNQWYEDAVEMYPSANIFMVHGEIKNAEERIFAAYKNSVKNYKPIIVITTIMSFLIDKYAKLYNRIDYEKLLIVDEAHNFYNNMSEELKRKYKYRLGLSATPVFGSNSEKTKELLDWFGGIVMDFPIEKAIGKYLVNYEYHPIIVYTTEDDEKKFNKATQLMLSAMDSASHKIIDEEKFTLGYRGRLRALSMAEEKIEEIDSIFGAIKDEDHTIIYCSDGKLFYENKKKNEQEEIRHLELMLKLINNSLIGKGLQEASKFTATEDVNTRMELINCFNKGYLQYLVAIRCLDEGINIPSIKSALILSSNDNYREFVQRRGRILRTYKLGSYKKEKADIYDVIVLPSSGNRSIASIELRRYLEYSRLALNKQELLKDLDLLLEEYNLTLEDIKFDNDYICGGDLDE